jgi:hypothetical protein
MVINLKMEHNNTIKVDIGWSAYVRRLNMHAEEQIKKPVN